MLLILLALNGPGRPFEPPAADPQADRRVDPQVADPMGLVAAPGQEVHPVAVRGEPNLDLSGPAARSARRLESANAAPGLLRAEDHVVRRRRVTNIG